jgi:hypothetical protein
MTDKKEISQEDDKTTTGLSLETVASQLSPKQRLLVTEETLDEINKLATDPDYGEEFLDSYLTHLNVLKDAVRADHRQYLNAIKFFTLVESGNSLTDSYIKVFPERFDKRRQNFPKEEQKKDIMRSEASRFNRSVLVNEIRKVAAIPVQLIHRHLLHEAILEQANLMKNARSEMVRQRAGATLITELKPTEDNVLNVKVEDESGNVIKDLREAVISLAAREREAILAGVPLKDIAESDIIDVTPETLEENDGRSNPDDDS